MASGNSYRDTNVAVVELESGEFYIVASLSSRRDTQVISVDPTTGALRYTGQEQIDNFQSEAEAVKFITSGSRWPVKSAVQARSILGYAALGGVGLLLLAIRVRASIQDLPNGDCVYTVMESQWVKIPLRNPQPLSKAEAKSVADLTDIAIDGMHFFCETRDITRPFPSNAPVDDPDLEFCWNVWLSSPFKDIGLQHHCAVLLQGIADSRRFPDSKGQYATVALIARRSRLHPGTRYLARGLNAAFSTGNEAECEQLVWPSGSPPGKPVSFSSYLWRRGTIPIWWGAEIKSTVSEAEIYISETNTYKGSAHYFQRLVFRYGTKERRPVPIVCVNLLRGAVGKSEVPLLDHFQECVNRLKANKDLGDAVLCLLNYDWHANIKLLGDMKTVDGLWQILQAPTMDIGFKLGVHYPSSGRGPGGWKITEKQAGVIRFNCADSLDRTNAASFFGGVQVFAEQCRKLGISLDSPRSSLEPRRSVSNGPLPEGWERRKDTVTGQIFYVDHNTRTTTWDHPCPDEAWHRFAMTAEQFKLSTLTVPIAMLADLFLIAGDIHATQYTGSKAMHSQILHIFGEDAAKAKRAGAAQNMAITLHRRYLNVLVDNTRQKQLEMFLGLHRYQHIPSIAQRPLQIMTRSHACLLKPIPSAFPNLYPANALINVKCKDMIWICNPAAEIVEVFILLSEPCHVCQLLITLAHGMEDTTSPASFDVRAGRHLDGMKVLLEGVSLPRCANGTQVLYSLPGAMSSEDVAITGGQYLPWLYDYEEREGELDFLTRFVSVTFYRSAPGVPITLGEVEVIGLPLFSNGIWQELDQTPQDTVLGTFGLEALDLSDGASSNHPVSGLDLLTGDFTGPVRQSSSATPNRPVERMLSRKTTVRRQSSDEAQRYCEKLMMLCENNLAKQLSYSEAMELELLRLGLGLSAAERDRILLSCGKDPATLNPNALVHRSNLSPLRQAAMQLHILNQIVSEDQELRSIGLPPKPQERASSPNHAQACSHKDCEVVLMRKSSMVQGSSTLMALSVCSGCRRKVCSTCLAGKGSAALASIQGPVGASASSGVIRDRASFDAAFCKKCCPPLVQDAILLHSLRQLLYRRKKLLFESAVLTANQCNASEGVADYSAVLKGEASLAVYPKSTFLFSVPSDPRFEQAMSLISPEPRSFWMAPAKTSSVELAVVLDQPSVVSGVILLVSPCGYTLQDVPIVEAWCGTTVSDSDRKYIGKWDINAASGTPQQQLFGPEANVSAGPENPRHLVYRFPGPARCRIVWIKLSLSGPLNQPMDLISFDSTTQGGRKSQFFGGTPRLHARGILVTGQKLPDDFVEASSNLQTSDKLAWKSMIEAQPKFGRLKVQTDSERFNEAGRVIELVISQTAPNISGFRLDALLALKSVAKYTPLSNKPRTLSGAFEAMDEFSLNPVPLSIRVMAVQASDQPVFVGNFTLPVAKAGTPLYFDFGSLIEARKLYFELNGDFSSFLDDEAGGDTDSKEVPFPASISLSGKIIQICSR